MRRQLLPAIISVLLFTVLLGLVYPLVITGVGQVAFKHKADGSIVSVDGKQVGSTLIGQSFLDAKGRPIRKYFQSRPSAATGAEGKTANGYDPTFSAGSNLGPTNPTLIKAVAQRANDYRKLNGLASSVKVPVDAVTDLRLRPRSRHLDRQRPLAGEAGRGCARAGREEGARPHRRSHRRTPARLHG